MSVSKIKDTRKQGTKILIILAVVGIVVFFGYGPLFELVGGGVPGRVIGATFGSIFAILMTMFLLNKQTEIEQESKKSERVFDEKVKLYKSIIESAKNMLKDNELDTEEMLALPFTLIQMQMVGGDEAIKIYTEFFKKINDIYDDDKDNEIVKIPESKADEVFSLLSQFSVQCRVDLGISDTHIDKTILKRAITALEQSNNVVKGKRDTSKYTFNRKAYKKGRLVHAVVKDFVVKNPKTTFDELKKAFPNEWQAVNPNQRNRAVFVRLSDAELLYKNKGHKRHFLKDEDTIQLLDEIIAVSNQWGIGNIGNFIAGANKSHNSKIFK
ncbi:hypothetical protein N9I89_04590 [Porticoccaceae bacterium]|jgi:hypothetical protein|nr:hypothetical protein [Porticoccaceae bacterium]MDA8899014.1 hypothetical protein [Porticoccaceae bacterium]